MILIDKLYKKKIHLISLFISSIVFFLVRGPEISSLLTRAAFCTDLVQDTRPQPVVLRGGEGPVVASAAHAGAAHATLVTGLNAKRHDVFHLDAQLLGRLDQEPGAKGGAGAHAGVERHTLRAHVALRTGRGFGFRRRHLD